MPFLDSVSVLVRSRCRDSTVLDERSGDVGERSDVGRRLDGLPAGQHGNAPGRVLIQLHCKRGKRRMLHGKVKVFSLN